MHYLVNIKSLSVYLGKISGLLSQEAALHLFGPIHKTCILYMYVLQIQFINCPLVSWLHVLSRKNLFVVGKKKNYIKLLNNVCKPCRRQ